MYSAYVGNANEACNMLALRIAGSTDAFVRMMNEKASEFGAVNTRFINPHGQYDERQVTTAYDQFLIFSEAMKSSLFAEIAGTFRHITEGFDETESRTFSTSNHLLNQSSRYYYRHSVAGRDSVTHPEEGGHSLITMTEEDGLTLITVVLGSNEIMHDDGSVDLNNFTDALRIIMWGYDQFAWRDILKTTDLLARVDVLHGSGADFVNVRPDSGLTLLLNKSIPSETFNIVPVIFSKENGEDIVAPVEAGEILGEVIVYRKQPNGTEVEIARRDLIANTSISLSGIEYMRGQVVELLSSNIARNIIIVLCLILGLYIALVVRYNIVRANRLRKIKNAKQDIMKERQQTFRD